MIAKHWGRLAFVGVWLVVLIVPPLRELLRLHAVGSDYMRDARYGWTPHRSGKALEALARQHPDDVRVLIAAAQQADRDFDDSLPSFNPSTFVDSPVVARYSALLQRFPNDVVLLADRLCASNLEDGPTTILRADTMKPIVGASMARENVRRNHWRSILVMAQKGQRVEPDNAFFDWIAMHTFLALHQDANALRVAHEGAGKARFDDHSREDTQNTIAVEEMQHPLLLEEKVAIAQPRQSSYLEQASRVAGLLAAIGVQHERAGDHARALIIYDDLARLGALMSRTPLSQSFSEGVNVQCIAWAGALRDAGWKQLRALNLQHQPGARVRLTSQRFVAYATAHGRPDLAAQAIRAGQAAWDEEQARSKIQDGYLFPVGIPVAVTILRWLGLGLLLQLAVIFCVRLALGCIVWSRRPEGGLVQNRDLAWSVGLCTLSGVFLAAAGMVEVVAYQTGVPIADEVIGILLGGAFLSPFLSAPFCSFIMARRWWRNRDAWPPPGHSVASSRNVPRDVIAPVTAFCVWTSLLATAAWWILAAIGLITGLRSLDFSIPAWLTDKPLPVSIPTDDSAFCCAGVLTIGCWLAWIIKSRWFSGHLRPLAHYGLRWHRQTLRAFLLVSSVLYLLSLVASLPLRKAAEVEFARRLEGGQSASLRRGVADGDVVP